MLALSMRLFAALLVSLSLTPGASSLPASRVQRNYEHPRAAFVSAGVLSGLGALVNQPASALASVNARPAATVATASTPNEGTAQSRKTVIYHPISIDADGVQVPVAAWHPPQDNGNLQVDGGVSYKHRIAVTKIAKLLAGWNLPSFVDRNFELQPTSSLDGASNIQTIPSNNEHQFPRSAPVVLLAHGYLGSRYDLSHLGEVLASEGFLVLAPEYPESLAASYEPSESATGIPIDRTIITNQVLKALTEEWNVRPTAYGIVGHSLGCGTVDRTGDSSWTRVCLAGGFPSLRGPNCLFVGSVNDGAVPVGRAWPYLNQNNFAPLDEGAIRSKSWDKLPPRSYLIFNNADDAPNHISFLAEDTNDAMVEFLSPLLPLARAMNIPVLDFDKYQTSRDSKRTGDVVIPLVVDYLKQMMRVP